MKREEFDELVKKLEPLAARNPMAYRVRVALLALFGSAVILGALILSLALTLALVLLVVNGDALYFTIKALIFVGALDLLIIRSLWVKIAPPKGVELSPADAAPLFDLVEEIRAKLNCPRVDHIVLDSHFNAAMAAVPRLGMFALNTNYLVVGLPLMQALSPDEFRSVVAHELGHLSRRHDRFSHWIYGVNKTWLQLLESLEKSKHRGAKYFKSFFNWYAPYFHAYSFVLDRSVEYEADRAAAEMAGARYAADALVALELRGAYLSEEFWPSVYLRARAEPEPPPVFGADLPVALKTPLSDEEARRWLDRAMAEETNSSDTHPALRERLKAIGQDPRLPPTVTETAADRFLGTQVRDLAALVNRAWTAQVESSWRKQYATAQEEKAELRGLVEKAALAPLADAEAFARALLTEEYGSRDEAILLYRALLDTSPTHTGATFALGRALIQQKNEEGIAYLRRTIETEEKGIVQSCELLYEYFIATAREEEANSYLRMAIEFRKTEAAAKAERSGITDKDPLIPDDLPESTIDSLRAQIGGIRGVGRVYLARKDVKVYPERPFYVLAVKERFSWKSGDTKSRKKLLQAIRKGITAPPGTWIVILPKGRLERRIARVRGSRIYP